MAINHYRVESGNLRQYNVTGIGFIKTLTTKINGKYTQLFMTYDQSML